MFKHNKLILAEMEGYIYNNYSYNNSLHNRGCQLNLIEKWQAAYRKGFAKPIILNILYNEVESYPYRITKQISANTHGQLTIAPSNIYPILKEMVHEDLIYEKGVDERRIIYSITKRGRAFFEDLSNHLCEFLSAMQKNFDNPKELKKDE